MSLLGDVAILPTNPDLRAASLLALFAAAGSAFATEASLSPPPVAEATEPSATTSVPAPDARAQAHAEFRALLDAGDYAAAVERAQAVVQLTERGPGTEPEELQSALMNLGLAQYRAGDYLAAEASYLRVIELIEAAGRLTSPRLARAHAGLGITYHAARRYDLAAVILERAIALNRRAEGLFNEEQLPLLEKQADSLSELGRFDEALLARRYALRVVGRRHGEESLPFARELESLGRWYTRVRSYEAARVTLRRAADLVVSLEGQDSHELVGPLSGLAENARRWLLDPQLRESSAVDEERRAMLHDTMPAPPSMSMSTIASEGLRALERAAAIVDAGPDTPPALVAAVHSQLGDWHQARQLPERARPHYQRAWQAAGAVPDGGRLQQSLFGAPVLIRYTVPESWDRYARRPPEEAERRHVEIELTVTADGGVLDPVVVSDTGDPRLTGQALRAVATARYRPRLVEGEPQQTRGVRFIQPFYVLIEAAPAEPPAPATPQGQRSG
jgi:tetratricopeptide (TPR) repeat protein